MRGERSSGATTINEPSLLQRACKLTRASAQTTATATSTPAPIATTRVLTYTYDDLQRLTGAVESPGSSFAYAYDLAGNRTGVSVNGTQTMSRTYDAADQVTSWIYDQSGNLTNDGTTSYSYDALNHLSGTTAGTQPNTYTYNGDGTLVSATNNGTTTSYTQDLAASQSQILTATTGLTGTDYLYGQDIAPLTAMTGGVRTWYGLDAQGSVRQTLDDTGIVLGNQNYDPFGQIEVGSSLTSPFGYTGELQNGTTGQEYLRVRWYQPGAGTLLGVDPTLGSTGQAYAYAGNDPVNGSDPSGQCTFPGGELPGIDGAGSCDTAIQGALVRAGGAVAGGILNNQSQFIATLNQELAEAEGAAIAQSAGVQSTVLPGSGCANRGACASVANGASSGALATPSQVAGPTGVATNGHLTGLLLGKVTGTQSQLSVAVYVFNGQVALAVSVHTPGATLAYPTVTCTGGTSVAAGSLLPAALPALGLAGLAGAAEEGVVTAEEEGRGIGGVPGALVLAGIGIVAVIVIATLSDSLPPPDEPKPTNWVVRGGEAQPSNLQAGYTEHRLLPGLFGFSVQFAPYLSVDELARAGRFPNATISFARLETLEAAAVAAGYVISLTKSPTGPFHHTLSAYNLNGEMLRNLPLPLAIALSAVFQRRPNPYRVPRT